MPKPWAIDVQTDSFIGHTYNAFVEISADNCIALCGDNEISNATINTIAVNAIIANIIVGFIYYSPYCMFYYITYN
jgi:hypothetical protein